jgi:hypothetical protein
MRYQPYFGHLAGDEAIVKPTLCGRFCVHVLKARTSEKRGWCLCQTRASFFVCR